MKRNAGGRAGQRLVTAGTLMLSLVGIGVRTDDPDRRTLAWMQSVLDAWQTTTRRDLHVPPQSPPWIIFYDDSSAWHLNPDTAGLPSHTKSKATLRYANRRYTLTRVANDGKLWVPGRDPLPLKPRSVTMVDSNGQKPFTILPLPRLFQRLAPTDQVSDLDKAFLGAAMHELTHTRHLVGYGKRLEQLRARYRLPETFDDNIIQERYAEDTVYAAIFAEERTALNDALFAKTPGEAKSALGIALATAELRKKTFFDNENAGFSELEDFYLVLEGAGMWAEYQHARRVAPASETWQRTLGLMMNRTRSWSQGEGLALFVLLDRFRPNWQASFMSETFPSIFATLREVR
jgi:hypothetical protein